MTPSPSPQSPSRLALWITIVVIVVAAILILASLLGRQQGTQMTANLPSPTPVYATPGEVVPSFPRDLLLDPQASVQNSYSLTYSSTTNQYTAEWNSSTTMPALFQKYQAYFKQNGWTIVNQITSNPAVRGLYAVNASSDVNVAITPLGSGSQATVSVVQR